MELTFSNAELVYRLGHLATGLQQTAPLMKDIADVLVSEALLNFHAQGRPKWAGLSPRTLASRKHGGGVILQDSGMLRNSVVGSHTATTATVGAGSAKSAAYAAIHQFGGQAGRGLRTRIVARPYLPMDRSGRLQPQAELAVADVVDFYVGQVLR